MQKRMVSCSYGDNEPVWCGIEAEERIFWFCRSHYMHLLRRIEKIAEERGEASLSDLFAAGERRVRLKNQEEKERRGRV